MYLRDMEWLHILFVSACFMCSRIECEIFMNLTPSSQSFISLFVNKVAYVRIGEILRLCDAKHFRGKMFHVWVMN